MNKATKNPICQDGADSTNTLNPFYQYCNMEPINNTTYLTRPVSFAGLPFGATDIDLLTEYHGQIFIFADMKYRDAGFSAGQKRAFVSIVDALQEAGKEAILFRVSHCSTAGTILAADGSVAEWYYNHRWKEPEHPCTLAQRQADFIQMALKKHEFGGEK